MNFLFSQIGYHSDRTARIVLRPEQPHETFPEEMKLMRCDAGSGSNRPITCPVTEWGAHWGCRWGVAELPGNLDAGVYRIENGKPAHEADFLTVGAAPLLTESLYPVAILQAERRQRLAKTKPGWRDCGSWLQEANSHAVYLWGLMDVLERAADGLEADHLERLKAQVVHGLEALASYQDLAKDKALGVGALIHEPNAQPDIVIRNDVVKAALAFARAARLGIAGGDWRARAEAAYRWACEAPMFRPETIEHRAHGAPEGYVPDANDCQTCDLFLMASVAMELSQGNDAFAENAQHWLRRAMARQIPEVRAEHGFWGQFYAFGDEAFSEKAWTHHGISVDTGQTFSLWLFPFIDALRCWPDHADVSAWKRTLELFLEGYFLPACESNPFQICPLGVYADEGLLEFAGLWHGMNTVYGYAAALALELMPLFPAHAERLERIATGNLQWIAGLHAGVTAESLTLGSHVFHLPIQEGNALPLSMIFGVGRRSAGSWTTFPGSITNGFSVGDQFRFDREPTRANDRPESFNDEDWITHAGAWLAGVVRYALAR